MRRSSSRSGPSQTAAVVMLLSVSAAGLTAAHLQPEAAAAWTAYVSATERRIAGELASPRGFLASDFDRDAAEDRSAVLGGAVVVRKMETLDAQGGKIVLPSALVHHWRGEVLVAGITVAQLMAKLQFEVPPRNDDVLDSRVLERGPDRMRVFLRLQRKSLVTVVYNTEHLVTFARYGSLRATSSSTATRIAEVSDPNTAGERELPVGDDRGFLWRLNSYWRYEDVIGGVIAECESFSLSRDVPLVVRPLAVPLIDSTARHSMEQTLGAFRAHFARG